MSRRLAGPVRASRLARELGLELLGGDREIRELCCLDDLGERGLSFIRDHQPAASTLGTVMAQGPAGGLSVIRSPAPRLDFIRAQHILARAPGFAEDISPPQVHPTAVIGRSVVIDNGVSIGEGTRIGSLAMICSGTTIGRFCEIESGAVIGASGFGFERDENQRPLRMIHLGGVRIGDFVEVGSLSTVCRGALSDTVIEDHVKIDDHSHVSHNCRIGEGAIITACVEISGSVRIGRNVWLAPNCCLVQKISVGDGAFVGIGAVVAHNVEPGARVFGNPARPIAAFAKERS